MALQAIASVLGSDPTQCLASSCDKKPYQDLIVTKCSHIFCKVCLESALATKKECPVCRGVLPGIETVEGREEYINFEPHLDRFTHYVSNDLSTLIEKLTAAKVEWCFQSCKDLKAAKTKNSPAKDGTKKEETDDHCSICLQIPFQMYFIIQDKIGRHMHEGCWQETVNDDDKLLPISVYDLVKVAKQLPAPKELPPEPVKPTSPLKVVFVAVILPISIWALAMNARVYQNKSVFLYLLSVPALVIFKALSLLLNGIKAVLAEKPT